MIGEPGPHEPDDPGKEEFDPLEDIGPEVPEVDVPEAPDPSENDVDPEVARDFWKLVATFNLALFALALGPMLAFFQGELVNGGIVFLVGLAAAIYGYHGYRTAKANLGDDSNTDDPEADTTDESDSDDPEADVTGEEPVDRNG